MIFSNFIRPEKCYVRHAKMLSVTIARDAISALDVICVRVRVRSYLSFEGVIATTIIMAFTAVHVGVDTMVF